MKKCLSILIVVALLFISGCETEKVAVLIGEPNPESTASGEEIPDMSGRPINLIPGEIPRRVRYKFSEDDVVIAAAENLKVLLSGETGSQEGLSKILMVQPGAWGIIKDQPAIRSIPFTPLSAMASIDGEMTKREGALLKSKEDGKTILREVKKLLGNEFEVRCLRSMEMSKWWVFIGFDIDEPVFVIESEGRKYKFIFSYTDSGLFIVDELNTLPDVT